MASSTGWHSSACCIVLITLFRIALIFPLEIYANYGQNHMNVINGHIELHNGTYTHMITAGEKITATWGNVAFYWNWAIFIPAIYVLPPLSLIITGIDTMFTVFLSMATHYQTIIVPHSMGACNPLHNGNFSTLLRPAGANESFFQIAARLNATVTTPQKMCESFVAEWQYGVAMSFFYAFIVLLGITAFLNHLRLVKTKGISLWKPAYDTAKAMILYPFQLILACLFGVLWLFPFLIPQMFFRALPIAIKAPIRSGRRHAIKAALGIKQKLSLKSRESTKQMESEKHKKARYQGGAGEKSPLSEFLGIYDIFMLVIEDLHYLDVMNLSQVSKSVREAVLPVHDFDRRRFVIECYTCRSSSKFKCWACPNTTCSDCSQQPSIPETRLLHHFDHCRPYCSPCYQKNVLRRHITNAQKPHCSCAPASAKKTNLISHSRQVCKDCNRRTAADLVKLREVRVRLDLQRGLQNSGEKWTNCARPGCGQPLGSGPRWWVCKDTACEKECRSSCHQAWGTVTKSDEEKATGNAV